MAAGLKIGRGGCSNVRAAGMYEDMRTGLHHVLGIIGGKSGFCLILNKESLCESTNIVQKIQS